jgi:iron complex outermembrane receptor protein
MMRNLKEWAFSVGMVALGATLRAADGAPAATQPSRASFQSDSTSPTTRPGIAKGVGNGDAGASNSDLNPLADLSLDELMNLQVTSVSKSKQRIGDSAAAVTVITQDDMQRSGLHQIPEILRLSPGLFVQQGNQFTGWSVSARGFGALFSNKLLVLDDGRTVYTPLFSGVYWNTVDYPIPDLDRIEVIRGPGATLWGSNAVNGVINIISKDAKDTQGLMLNSTVGTSASDVSVRYGGQIDDDTYYRIYTKGTVDNDLQFSPNPVGENNQSQDARAGFRVDHYSSDTDTVTVQGDGFNQSASDQLINGQVLPDYGHDYRSGENLLARWTHVVSDTSDLSLQTYYDHIDFRDGYSTFHGDTFDVDFQHRFELMPNHEIIYGLGGRLLANDVGSATLPHPVVDPSARDTYQLSGFIQDTIALVPDRLHLIVGTKLEQDSFTGFDFQPSARLLWTPSEKTSVWGAVSRAIRTPSLNISSDFRGGAMARRPCLL